MTPFRCAGHSPSFSQVAGALAGAYREDAGSGSPRAELADVNIEPEGKVVQSNHQASSAFGAKPGWVVPGRSLEPSAGRCSSARGLCCLQRVLQRCCWVVTSLSPLPKV